MEMNLLQELRNEADVEADTENLRFGHSQQRQLVSKREKSKRGSKYAGLLRLLVTLTGQSCSKSPEMCSGRLLIMLNCGHYGFT